MKALDRKLLRDLSRLKGQLITIAMVVAAGIAAFISLRGTYSSLLRARDGYYEAQRFAQVFARVERAPEAVGRDLERIPGVSRVETRIINPAALPLPDVPRPLQGEVLSLPPLNKRSLNNVSVTRGRMVEPAQDQEILLLEAFATARKLSPGDSIPVVLEGKQRNMRIVGLARSPEYIYSLPPGALTQDLGNYAVMWMNRDALAAATGMVGAFNDISLELQHGANESGVVDALDRELERYGSFGAYGRARQLSNHILEGELSQLQAMGTAIPLTFLGVAALLLHIVLSRLVHLQRPEIATLKAVGYGDLRIGVHFLELVLAISLLGGVMGVGIGAWLGSKLVELYKTFFGFPDLRFNPSLADAGQAVAASFGAATLGALSAARRVVQLPPAEAMRPEAPAKYRRSLLDVLRLARPLGPAANMVVRELERHPTRAALSVLAIAASVSLMVVAGWYYDGVDQLVYTQFSQVMREDLSVTFLGPRPFNAIHSLRSMEGVLAAEGVRIVPVRFESQQRGREGAIQGFYDGTEMRDVRDLYGKRVELPPDGVVLSMQLAKILEVKVGDRIDAVLREGTRARRPLVVTGLVEDSFGLQGYMRMDALGRWMSESPMVSMALLRVDPHAEGTVQARLKDMPQVVAVNRRRDMIDSFEQQSGAMLITMAFVMSLFAATITVGVVYNNARVALSLRSRDLASLRVLGFHNSEVSSVLLGEMAVQVLAALPLGLWMGTHLVAAIASMIDPETYRLPVTLTLKSYAFAATVALAASIASALLVRRKVDRLDLIAVLKTRE
ncbi:MAG TPA: ABC transporter permease [Polyangiaceae bacterium]|nr:ABC transporter permease [Polyangiaceae bacterium]